MQSDPTEDGGETFGRTSAKEVPITRSSIVSVPMPLPLLSDWRKANEVTVMAVAESLATTLGSDSAAGFTQRVDSDEATARRRTTVQEVSKARSTGRAALAVLP